ncbi:MAG: hypothetical protein HZC28_20610 [Spirochaetes bacterium]|nr:hypothetical protein [Spirochaetota bacterium]
MRRIFILLFVLISSGMHAEVIYLHSGDTIKGSILSCGEQTVTVKTDYGTVSVDRTKIKTIDFTETTDPALIQREHLSPRSKDIELTAMFFSIALTRSIAVTDADDHHYTNRMTSSGMAASILIEKELQSNAGIFLFDLYSSVSSVVVSTNLSDYQMISAGRNSVAAGFYWDYIPGYSMSLTKKMRKRTLHMSAGIGLAFVAESLASGYYQFASHYTPDIPRYSWTSGGIVRYAAGAHVFSKIEAPLLPWLVLENYFALQSLCLINTAATNRIETGYICTLDAVFIPFDFLRNLELKLSMGALMYLYPCECSSKMVGDLFPLVGIGVSYKWGSYYDTKTDAH